MEDSERKLELLLECYLGKWHPLYWVSRVEINEWGIGNAYSGMRWILYGLSKSLGNVDEQIGLLNETYKKIAKRYEELPLSEMDESDPEFKPFFQSKILLNRLGVSIDCLIKTPSKEQIDGCDELIQQLQKSILPNYEDRIRELHRQIYVEPTISIF